MDSQKQTFLDAIQSESLPENNGELPFILGLSKDGALLVENLADVHHLLITGIVGTGKSTLTHAILLSSIAKTSPDDLKILLCDTKAIEYCGYAHIPHLLVPSNSCSSGIAGAIQWMQLEISRRLKLMSSMGARSLDAYNGLVSGTSEPKLHRILFVIDDNSVFSSHRDLIDSLASIIQMGRAAGMHVLLVALSPVDKRLNDIVKTLMPAKAVFNISGDAEKRMLLGAAKKMDSLDIGEMIFSKNPSEVPQKVHCFEITDADIRTITSEVIEKYGANAQSYTPTLYCPSLTEQYAEDVEEDEMFPYAVDIVMETGQASVSMIQRQLDLGYARAARLLDAMEEAGIVGPFQGSRPRSILITNAQWQKAKALKGRPLEIVPSSCASPDAEKVDDNADTVHPVAVTDQGECIDSQLEIHGDIAAENVRKGHEVYHFANDINAEIDMPTDPTNRSIDIPRTIVAILLKAITFAAIWIVSYYLLLFLLVPKTGGAIPPVCAVVLFLAPTAIGIICVSPKFRKYLKRKFKR